MRAIQNESEAIQQRLQGKRERDEQFGIDLDALLNERDISRITGLSLATIRRWRLLGQGPKFRKCGSAVRYKPQDVSDWLDSRPSGGEHQQER
jgi:predicted DNA-binding transcriptional regulator AlpA